ncbi:hypothetical protein EQV77_04765 [Halobacillus fulvus]|nr:hypothetical protein EQV77_04765 [Halobacillus fulvus]
MDVAFVFLLFATITPVMLLQLKKPVFAVVQTILLIGMWLYCFQMVLYTPPAAFSISWTMFYASLIGAHVAWLLFVMAIIKESPGFQESLKEQKETLLP